MRNLFQVHSVAVLLSLTAFFSTDQRLRASEPTSAKATRPSPSAAAASNTPRIYAPALGSAALNPTSPKTATTMEKLRNLGALLGRALDVAVDLLSGNETDLLSRNKTALLSGNKPEILSGNKAAILSGNKPEILSGNKPAILSGNTTPILSGNTFSVLSNIKIEIHINNSGNSPMPGVMPQPGARVVALIWLRGRAGESRRALGVRMCPHLPATRRRDGNRPKREAGSRRIGFQPVVFGRERLSVG